MPYAAWWAIWTPGCTRSDSLDCWSSFKPLTAVGPRRYGAHAASPRYPTVGAATTLGFT